MAGIVITGSSSGIGRAITLELAQRHQKQGESPTKLIVQYRKNEAGANQTADAVRSKGLECDVLKADFSQPAQTDRFVDEAFERLGTVQTWVNNAGADILTGPVADQDFETKLQHLWNVDVLGTIRLSRRVGERLKKQPIDSDSIPPGMIFIGWDQAPEGMEGDAGMLFGSTKAAVMAFANSLAQTLAPHVRVNTVAPGWIKTSWGESTSDYWNQRAASQALMHRWGRPEDVARAVAYLADPANAFITSQTIRVNGGWNRRYPV